MCCGVRKRDFQMAELAVEGYLRSSESFENPEHWPDAADRIERATRIAVSLGPKNKKFAEVFTHIEAVLDRNKPEESSFLSAKMMELLLEFGQGDPNKYTTLADKAAGQAEYESNWHKALVIGRSRLDGATEKRMRTPNGMLSQKRLKRMSKRRSQQ